MVGIGRLKIKIITGKEITLVSNVTDVILKNQNKIFNSNRFSLSQKEIDEIRKDLKSNILILI